MLLKLKSKLLPVVFLASILQANAQSSADIFERLNKLKVCNTVLYVAAHPDDENTRLITWLSKEKKYRTVYLSLTRGDGGQNLIGTELGAELGMIRTRELMAARSIDGGEQFFTRAFDFGYSKRPEETLNIWEKEKVLEDFTGLIRQLRPDVMICRFPPDSRAGHGHHSASAILAKEAFEAAADPLRFPQQVKEYGVWKVNALYWNTFNFGSNNTLSEDQFKTDVGAFSPLLGVSYGELAAESRSQHKSQGFGVPSQRGTQIEYFTPVAGDTLSRNPFAGMVQYWDGSANKKVFLQELEKAIADYDFLRPSASLPALSSLRKKLQKLPADPVIARKLRETEELMLLCAGFWSAAYSYSREYAAGDTLHIGLQAILRNHPAGKLLLNHVLVCDSILNDSLAFQKLYSKKLVLKGTQHSTQPYWLKNAPSKGIFNVDDGQRTTLPWNPAALSLRLQIVLAGDTLEHEVPVQFKETDPVKGELIHPVSINPIVTAELSENVAVFAGDSKRTFTLQLRYWGAVAGTDASKTFRIRTVYEKNVDWKLRTEVASVSFREKGEKISIQIDATPLSPQARTLKASFVLEDGEQTLTLQGRKVIQYDHIPIIQWYPPLTLELRRTDVRMPVNRILYLKGAGDEVAPMLRQLGCVVDEMTAAEAASADFSRYESIVTGIRAYNTDEDLPALYDRILRFMEAGGTFLVQYNTNSNLHPGKFRTPYPYTISRNRVTEEDAPVTLAAAEHPLLNSPNKITEKDFEGWVQERGLYFASKADSAYTHLLKMNDTGEAPMDGSLIVCNVGKGRYIYTGLSFFRQIPKGVPGALRLFANLLQPATTSTEPEK